MKLKKMNTYGRDAMALKQREFEVLYELDRNASKPSQRQLAEKTGLSLGTVNKTLNELAEKQLTEDGAISARGLAALEPYRVDNAVIMAAGLSSRFAPISYEKPKGLLKVRGEVLIERQIRQLKEAGIDDITVVVGYKKERLQERVFLLSQGEIRCPHCREPRICNPQQQRHALARARYPREYLHLLLG